MTLSDALPTDHLPTDHLPTDHLPTDPSHEPRERLRPLLAEIADGAPRREVDGALPAAAMEALRGAGFGALRVPVEHGGAGLPIPDLTHLWIDLAAADPNLTQALRGHFALVEDRLWQHGRGRDQSRWLRRFAAGEIAGNAWSEAGPTLVGGQRTTLTRDGGHYVLEGEKAYTTGTRYAQWADVLARRVGGPTGAGQDDLVTALVDTRSEAVRVRDDWDGVGQRGTASGTTTFVRARVLADDVLPAGERFAYQTAFYQLNLVATLAGIARGALRDVVTEVRGRTRTYSHANTPHVRDDPQVLARVGEIASAASMSEAATLRVADALQAVVEVADDDAACAVAVEAAEIEAAAAQVGVSELVLRATSDLFDALGASALVRTRVLDRHWRNARTVASHNPRLFKARVVGDHLVNGTPPPYSWGIGTAERHQAWSPR